MEDKIVIEFGDGQKAVVNDTWTNSEKIMDLDGYADYVESEPKIKANVNISEGTGTFYVDANAGAYTYSTGESINIGKINTDVTRDDLVETNQRLLNTNRALRRIITTIIDEL